MPGGKKKVVKKKGGDDPAPRRSSRSTKAPTRLVEQKIEDPKVFVVEDGNGTKLADIPWVLSHMNKPGNKDLLYSLHLVIFGRGKKREIKTHLKEFSGFSWDDEDYDFEREKRMTKLSKWDKASLLDACTLFSIKAAKSSNNASLVDKILNFLDEPSELPALEAKSSRKRSRSPSRSRSRSRSPARKKQKTKGKKGKKKKKATVKKTELKKIIKDYIEENCGEDEVPKWIDVKKELLNHYDSEDVMANKDYVKNFLESL
eukprot:TRINITY_DN1342_c0_g1_i2.p1 TRINITY_DN1342_c0_g1~~TRINITY_DN1342_c0_g1_i2.p1  ORF type:complete len:259 (-),score=108.46 TRINITY_DN1342_c0_g1_i2:225-1001(-)